MTISPAGPQHKKTVMQHIMHIIIIVIIIIIIYAIGCREPRAKN